MIRLATLTLAGATLLPAAPQDDGQEPRNQLPKASQIVAVTFQPKHLETQSLFNAVRGMLSFNLMVQDDETGAVSQRSNLQMIGRTLVLFDLPRSAERNLALLTQLDQEAGQSREVENRDPLVTVEYAPRHLSMEAVSEALVAFSRFATFHGVHESSLVVLSGPRSVVDEMRALLERIDVPAPQVNLTCYLITPGEEGRGALPDELTRGLTELTGIGHFRRAAMGMVRSSVEPDARISLRLDAGPSESFTLELVPAALDERSTTLTLSSCTLRTQQSATFGNGAVLFQTATSVEGGRFTVLGAAGADPYFVVLQAAPAGR